MLELMVDHWSILVSVAAGVWAVLQYISARKRQLAWERTEFILEQSQLLDSDPELRECTMIVYGKHPRLRIADALKALNAPAAENDDQAALVLKFEKFLNFLWRIAYAQRELRTLTKKDLCAFGAYLHAVNKDNALREYCLQEGYEEIIHAANDLE